MSDRGLFRVGALALRFSEIKYTYLVTPCHPRPAGLLVVMRAGSLFVPKDAGGDPCTWLKLETALRRRTQGASSKVKHNSAEKSDDGQL